jgi:hypothetical protein
LPTVAIWGWVKVAAGDVVVWHLLQVFRVQQVVAHRAHLCVCDVFEHVRGGDVAQGPDSMGGGRAAVVIHTDASAVGHLDSSGGQVQPVSVRDASGGYQQYLPGGGGAVVEVDGDAVVRLVGAGGGPAGTDVEAFGGQRVEPVVEVFVELPQERGAGDDRDVGAEGVEDVGELHGDVASADDHQGLGQFRKAHDVFVGVVPHARVGDGLGDHGPGACGNDDLVTGNGFLPGALAGPQSAFSDKDGMLVIDIDVRGPGATAVLLTGGGDRDQHGPRRYV